jgi:hypothetical protein
MDDLHAFWQFHFAGSDNFLNAISSNNDGVSAQCWLSGGVDDGYMSEREKIGLSR